MDLNKKPWSSSSRQRGSLEDCSCVDLLAQLLADMDPGLDLTLPPGFVMNKSMSLRNETAWMKTAEAGRSIQCPLT